MGHSGDVPAAAEKPSRFIDIITRISSVMAGVGAIIFGGMMIITVIDVVGRKFFLHPLQGAVEIVGLTLIIGGTWGIGYAQLLRMHIHINILTEKFPPRVQAVFWVVICLISLIASSLISWRAFVKVHELFTTVLGSKSDILGLPLWPIVAMMAIGFTWASFIFLVDLIRGIGQVLKK